MKVIVLAAGSSKRLQPIRDKNFINFLGKPLLLLQIEQLLKVGLRDIIVVGGRHHLEEIRKVVSGLAVKIEVTEQKDTKMGQAGAVLACEDFLNGDSVFILSNNDVVDHEAYLAMIKAFEKGDAEGYITGMKVESYFPGGYLKPKENGYIAGIIEKPGAGNEPSDMVNLILHIFHDSKKLCEAIRKASSEHDDLYEVALNNLIQQGTKFKIVPYSGFWQPAKYPWHLLVMMSHWLDRLPEGRSGSTNVQIADSAIVKGKVYLEAGVKLLDQAVVIGPAYLGKNTIVATNALVRNSHVGDDCVVGFGTEIARSYLGNGVWTHTNYIGDSIIGNNNSFGAGTVTGNLRLDELNIQMKVQGKKIDSGVNKLGLVTGDNVRCGINSSFMPGVKIGNNSLIGAGIVIAQDIGDNKYVYGKTEMIIKENTVVLDAQKRDEMRKVFNSKP